MPPYINAAHKPVSGKPRLMITFGMNWLLSVILHIYTKPKVYLLYSGSSCSYIHPPDIFQAKVYFDVDAAEDDDHLRHALFADKKVYYKKEKVSKSWESLMPRTPPESFLMLMTTMSDHLKDFAWRQFLRHTSQTSMLSEHLGQFDRIFQSSGQRKQAIIQESSPRTHNNG